MWGNRLTLPSSPREGLANIDFHARDARGVGWQAPRRDQVAYLADHAVDADDKHLQEARANSMPIDAKRRIASLLIPWCLALVRYHGTGILVITILCDLAQGNLRRSCQNQLHGSWLCDCAEKQRDICNCTNSESSSVLNRFALLQCLPQACPAQATFSSSLPVEGIS